MIGVVVRLAWPEEPTQPVAFASWNDMYMEVGNTLAHPGVRGDERTGGIQSFADSPRHLLHDGEQGPDEIRWCVLDRLVVKARDDQDMTGKQGPVIEE